MIASAAKQQNASVGARLRRANTAWGVWIAAIGAISAAVSAQMVLAGPTVSAIAWLYVAASAAAIVYRPRYGVYMFAGLTMAGDASLLWWYPFPKNLSSSESIMYVNNALSVSPLELFVVLTTVVWLGRMLVRRKIEWRGGPLVLPSVIFVIFVCFGFVWGASRGGSLVIALWEVRGMFMLPFMIILVVNLLERREHIQALVWWITVALMLKSVAALHYVATELKFSLAGTERIAEHALSIQMAVLVVLAAATWVYGGSGWRKLILTPMLPLALFALFANQRRAAFVALALAMVLLAVLLFLENRRAFWMVVPVVAVMAVVYLAAFWNASGALGMPARAIKSAVLPGAANARDEASNVYRVLENINTMFNIRSAPLTGIGFGSKFYRIVPMPDISFFVFHEYITHNSVMWIWMQMGVGGFFVMLFLMAQTLRLGMRLAVWYPSPDMRAIAATATLHIVMHFVYAYVDMSWSSPNMVFIGVSMGVISLLSRTETAVTTQSGGLSTSPQRNANNKTGAGGR